MRMDMSNIIRVQVATQVCRFDQVIDQPEGGLRTDAGEPGQLLGQLLDDGHIRR